MRAAAILGTARESALIHHRIDAIAARGGGEHVGDQALVPAVNLMIDRPTVVRAPVPIEHLTAAAGVPVPFDAVPQNADLAANALFDRRVGGEVGPRA